MIYSCCDENRRAAVLNNPALNAIDYLELLDDPNLYGSPSQQTLLVTCLKPAPTNLTTGNILITGGESITGITALWAGPAGPASAQPVQIGVAVPPQTPAQASALASYLANLPNAANILVIRTSAKGDFSPYTLSLVNSIAGATSGNFAVAEVLPGFDPQLAQVTFSFKIDCGPFFDCAPVPPACSPAPPTPPPINYLAKDYGSFRTILLDRMNQLLPSWGATSEADLGIVLAELIAYAGDQLSYHQDAVATEAYIATARSRISLRRHARLVDYFVHDGANARAWVCLNVSVPVFLDRTVTRFYTYAAGMPTPLLGNEQAALDAGAIVFEPMQDANLFPEHNTMQFYTWGDLNCCLPQGATEATLAGSFPNLQAGDVLIFKEVLGPRTGDPADADIRHRYAVRLTSVATLNGQGQPLVDPLFEQGTGAPIVNPTQQPQPVTEIGWSTDDALPAPLCLSSTFLNDQGDTRTITNVSIVLGNAVLADHGLSMPATPLPAVPEPTLFYPPSPSANRCAPPTAPAPLPVRYRPQLADSPITQAVSLPMAGSPVTTSAVALVANGFVSLSDSNGYTSLMVGADYPAAWPQFFGVQASVDTVHSTFTLSVVFSPTGDASTIVLETFAGLTSTADAVTKIGKSQLIVASAPGAAPAKVAGVPTMLSNSGAVDLIDLDSGLPYLSVSPTLPNTWPPLFSVLAQGNLETPTEFNLLLLYNSPFGPVGGVRLPVIVEQFNNVSLASVGATFATGSALLSVLTFDQEPNPSLSAFDLMNYDPSTAVPSITLTGSLHGNQTTWTAAPDLLADGPTDTNFVVEIEFNGVATLRFGDNTNGMSPASSTAFTAAYRIGNGAAGNLGAESLVHLAADPRILSCTNPLPASGGVDPETSAQIQRRAPQAFLTQERAVTMADYVTMTEANRQVSSAAATLRWTGSWYTVFVAAESANGGSLSKPLRKSLTQYVNRYRLAGQDLKLEGPDYVSLVIALTVCVDPAYFKSDVQQALMQVLGSGPQPNGQPGYFAAGRFQLGQNVYLSPIYAAARTVAGVTTVTATAFQPQAVPQTNAFIQSGEIPIGPFQVARLANDPSLPANGQLTFIMQGGK
ncbi:MAG: putative baseplate assembly protein [Terracidiphilus sp.]|nr:putative baseplate assembly protein [Terracidiphilus sp.]